MPLCMPGSENSTGRLRRQIVKQVEFLLPGIKQNFIQGRKFKIKVNLMVICNNA